MPWKLDSTLGLENGEALLEELEKDGYEIKTVAFQGTARGPAVFVAARTDKRKKKEKKENE